MAFTLLYVTRDKYTCSAFLGWWSIMSLSLCLSLPNDASPFSSLQVLVLMTVPVEAPAWPSRTCPDLRGPLMTALYCGQGTASVSPTLIGMLTLSLPVTATEGSLGRSAHYVSVLSYTAVLLCSHQRNFRHHWLLICNLCFSSISFPHLSLPLFLALISYVSKRWRPPYYQQESSRDHVTGAFWLYLERISWCRI